MKLLTYFAFTLLSVVIQFCVMDFIQDNIDPEDSGIYLNASNKNNKNSIGILKNYAHDDHALYYRLKKSDGHEDNNDSFDETYIKSSRFPRSQLDDSTSTTTELSLTVYDLIYDEDNASMYGSTTESFFTSTELDNVTEITLFEKSSTTKKPNIPKTTFRNKDKCFCNLLHKQCDLDCCCDVECTVGEINLFGQCKAPTLNSKKQYWEQELKCDAGANGGFSSLFCIAKTNIPEKRVVIKEKVNEKVINDAFLWHDNYEKDDIPEFDTTFYRNGDPVWVFKNKSVAYLDLPACLANNYCSTRRTLKFLKDEKINCQVKFKELEMLRILKTVEESKVMSVTNNSLNNTIMNCSSFHCINWTIIYCDDFECLFYNKSLHEPICTDIWCSNVGMGIEYIFHVLDTKIVTAIIKFYTQKVSTLVQYIKQEISVQFLMGNASLVDLVKLSGNPGYVAGLPIIVSFAESNHTENFFNKSNENDLPLPSNNGGICFKSRITKKVLEFGYNRRLNCKIVLPTKLGSNGTEACVNIQSLIDKMLSVDRKIFISPYGNPDNVNDDNWLPIHLERGFIYGEYHSKRTKLHCFNLRTRVAFVFAYADLSDTELEENKLLSAKLLGFAKNMTFSTDGMTAVITVDVNFINANKLKGYDISGPPHLNLNLPRNFFLPSPSNKCNVYKDDIHIISYLCIAILLTK